MYQNKNKTERRNFSIEISSVCFVVFLGGDFPETCNLMHYDYDLCELKKKYLASFYSLYKITGHKQGL